MPERAVCKHCLAPIETVTDANFPGTLIYQCPTHGQVGLRLEGGELDLEAIRRDLAEHPPESEMRILGPVDLCLAHMLPEPCPTCAAYIAAGL